MRCTPRCSPSSWASTSRRSEPSSHRYAPLAACRGAGRVDPVRPRRQRRGGRAGADVHVRRRRPDRRRGRGPKPEGPVDRRHPRRARGRPDRPRGALGEGPAGRGRRRLRDRGRPAARGPLRRVGHPRGVAARRRRDRHLVDPAPRATAGRLPRVGGRRPARQRRHAAAQAGRRRGRRRGAGGGGARAPGSHARLRAFAPLHTDGARARAGLPGGAVPRRRRGDPVDRWRRSTTPSRTERSTPSDR